MIYGCVVASYKYGHLAGHAIETVLENGFDKIWFVDDGVGDCKHLVALYPQVDFTFREKNLGTVANFQDILERVDTDKVMFLGADNWIRPDTLSILKENEPADIIMYDGVLVGTQRAWIKSVYPEAFKSRKYQGGYYWDRKGKHHGSMLYNVELAKKVGGYWSNNKGRTIEDQNLFEDMSKAGATIKWVSEPLLYYRRHKHNYNPV